MKTTILAFLILGTTMVQADEKLYDDALAKKAVAVLRVERGYAFDLPHYPYTRYFVHVTHVYKNDSGRSLADIDVHGFKGREGVPAGTSTIYIERYNAASRQFGGKEGRIWMLVDGGGTNSVSHVGNQLGP